MSSMKDFDGFYLLPGRDETEAAFKFFKFKDSSELGNTIDGSDIGDMYHVAFFRKTDSGVEFDENFEAIFADPVVYANGLLGGNIFGTFLKKTENSDIWWNDYLKDVLGRVMITKMKAYAEAIANAETKIVE